MKSVYIDVLITVNVFIDFILILCTKKALCINTSFKKMLLASLLGGVQSLIALFPPLPFFLHLQIFDYLLQIFLSHFHSAEL